MTHYRASLDGSIYVLRAATLAGAKQEASRLLSDGFRGALLRIEELAPEPTAEGAERWLLRSSRRIGGHRWHGEEVAA